jgi:hypothetical protein
MKRDRDENKLFPMETQQQCSKIQCSIYEERKLFQEFKKAEKNWVTNVKPIHTSLSFREGVFMHGVGDNCC